MHITWTQYLVWFLGPALQALIAVLMVRHRLHRQYPMFFNYMIFQVLHEAINFIALQISRPVYYYTYWTLDVLAVVVSFLVLREIFMQAFRPYEALCELGNMLFRWSCLVLLIIGTVTALSSSMKGPELFYSVLVSGARSVAVMQCGMVLFMALLGHHLGVTWRQYLFGIAMGFGIFASIEMLATSALQVHLLSNHVSNIIGSSAYMLAVFIWLAYTWAPEVEPRKIEILPQSERWNHALALALDNSNEEHEGFLPSIDRTVERLLNERGGFKARSSSIH